MASLEKLEVLFDSLGFIFPSKIKNNILFNLSNNKYVNKHFSFLLDLKTNRILCYDTNIYFKSDSFPFSIHAEIQSINRYYKSKTLSKNKKILLVVKLSKTGIIGNSKCCLNCMRFIRNNFDNLNLKKIYYSILGNELVELSRDDLIDKNFHRSKGYNWREKL